MDVTGQILPLALLIPLLLLSLLVVILLFVNGAYRKDSFFFLLLLSLSLFITYAFPWLESNPDGTFFPLASSLLGPTLQYGLLLLLFRSFLKNHLRVDWIQYLLVIHLTVIATLWAVGRATDFSMPNTLIEAVEVSIMAVLVLLVLVKTRYLFIFSSPLFWIASGTLFFYLIFLSVEISNALHWIQLDPGWEKNQLLAAFSIVRSIFYLIAVLVYKKQGSVRTHP